MYGVYHDCIFSENMCTPTWVQLKQGGKQYIYNTWVQPSGVYSIKWNIQQSCQKTPFGFTSSCPSFLWGQSPWPAPPGCPPSSPPLSSSLSTSPSPCRAPPEHSVYFLKESIIQKYLLKMLQVQQYDCSSASKHQCVFFFYYIWTNLELFVFFKVWLLLSLWHAFPLSAQHSNNFCWRLLTLTCCHSANKSMRVCTSFNCGIAGVD